MKGIANKVTSTHPHKAKAAYLRQTGSVSTYGESVKEVKKNVVTNKLLNKNDRYYVDPKLRDTVNFEEASKRNSNNFSGWIELHGWEYRWKRGE